MNLNEREILARTLQAEAGNQGLGGMIAAGSVIMNRVGSGGYGSNVRDVILAPGQFSAWNSLTGYAGGEQGQNMDFTPSSEAYKAADTLLSGQYEDITGGATHYYNPDISQPSWGMGSGGDWKRIGQHVFGKADAGKTGKTGAATMDRPTAQQMQQMQQQPQRRGLMGFLSDPRNRQVLSSFSRTEYGRRLGDIASADLARQQEQEALAQSEQKETQQRNRTADWLASQPNGEKYAQAIRQGAISASEAYSQYLSEGKRQTTTVDGKIIDKQTGQVIYEAPEDQNAPDLDKDQVSTLNSINDDLRARVKPFEEVRDGFQRIQTFFNSPSGVSDYALSVAFAKILDPGSVAREGEVAAVASAGGAINSFLRSTENFFSGKGALPAAVRAQIMNLATSSYQQQLEVAKQAIADAKSLATAAGIDPKFIFKIATPPAPSMQLPVEPPTGSAETIPQSAKDAGLTQQDWDKMLPDEKAPFQ